MNRADYQRERRAKIRAMADQTVSPQEAAVAKQMLEDAQLHEQILDEDPSLRSIKRRPPLRKEEGYSRDYSDLIQNMSQQRRDDILARINTSKARTPR